MKHEIQLEQDIIKVIFANNLELADMDQALAQVSIEASALAEQKKPVRVLVDLSKTPVTSPELMLRLAEFIKKFNFDRIACFAGESYIRSMAKIVALLSAREEKIKFFEHRDQALDWLNANE